MRFDRRIIGKRLLTGSAVLFVLSLGFQCFYCEGESADWSFGNGSGSGLLLLMIGWLGLFDREFSWLANPFYIFAMGIAITTFNQLAKPEELREKPDSETYAGLVFAIIFSMTAMFFSLSFLLQSTTLIKSGQGGPARIIGYNPGYFLWVASMMVQLVGVAVLLTHRIQADDRGSEI